MEFSTSCHPIPRVSLATLHWSEIKYSRITKLRTAAGWKGCKSLLHMYETACIHIKLLLNLVTVTCGFPHKGPVIWKAFPWHDVRCFDTIFSYIEQWFKDTWLYSAIHLTFWKLSQCELNTLRLRRNSCFTDNIFKFIFLNGNCRILNHISLKFVAMGSIRNIVWDSNKISLNFVPRGPISNVSDNGLAPTRWISNHKHQIEEKSTKSSWSSSKVFGLGLAGLWEFPTLNVGFAKLCW